MIQEAALIITLNNAKIDKNLISAVAYVESRNKKNSKRYESHYRWTYKPSYFARLNKRSLSEELIGQRTSWGEMQVMGAVAREYGFRGKLSDLLKTELNLAYGKMYLAKLIRRYKTKENAVSAYNQGTPRRFKNGKYKNQRYVDMVMRKYRKLNRGKKWTNTHSTKNY